MISRQYKIICYILIIFSATAYVFADSQTVFLNREFTIKVGESVQVERGLGFIKLIKILEDSRCPENVTCVWAGNVKTELEITHRDRKKTTIHLNSTVKPNKLLLKGYTLQLISILPAKTKDVVITEKKYQVKFRILPAKERA